MRLKLKVRLKAICVTCLLGILFYLGYYINTTAINSTEEPSDFPTNGRKVASIKAEEMELVGKLRQIRSQAKDYLDPHLPLSNVYLRHPLINASNRYFKKLTRKAKIVDKSCDDVNCVPENTNPENKISEEKLKDMKGYQDDERLYEDVIGINKKIKGHFSAVGLDYTDIQKLDDCVINGKKCKFSKTFSIGNSRQGEYSTRVRIESVKLPSEWTASEDLSRKIRKRKDHAKQVCHKYGLDKRKPDYRPNSWEFLINEKYGLVWCSVFKAASSTWFYNFNILAGYTETQLLSTKETPITLARKRYPRPTVNELDRVINSTNQTLSFMIVRHPLERLVSAFRDKLQSGNRFYRGLARKIMAAYPSLGPQNQMVFTAEEDKSLPRTITKSRTVLKYIPPSFQQFVQFIIESNEKDVPLDEHWSPMTNFCTPCLVDFDVYAKVESMDEDANYIIFKSGIEKLIQPKRINRSKNEPTNEVARSYLCQLSPDQIDGLLNLYKLDLEIFDYRHDRLLNCTSVS